MMIQQYTKLLQQKRFLPLFITQFLEALNDNLFKNAMLILVSFVMAQEITIPTSAMLALCSAIYIFPFFLFSATAGQLADKYEKSVLIRLIKLIEIGSVLIGGIGFYQHNLTLLLITLFALGVHSTFFGPIKYAILPDHLQKEELITGNALVEGSTFLAILLGTIIGNHSIISTHGELLTSGIALAVAITGLIASLFIPKSCIDQPTLSISWNFPKETFRIVQYATQKMTIFYSIIGLSWFWSIGAVFLSEFPDFVKINLQGDPTIVTLLLCTFSVGIAFGSFLIERLQKKAIHANYVPLGAIGISIFIIDLFFASRHPLPIHQTFTTISGFLASSHNIRILIDLFLISVFGGVFCVPLYTLLQYHAEPTHRSRVIAANNIVNAIMMAISAVFVALLAMLHIDVATIFLSMGLTNFLIVILVAQLLPEPKIKSILRWILRGLYRVEVHGLENYQHAGKRAVIIANHSSFLDPVLIAAFIPDTLLFAVNTYIAQSWWIKPALNLVDAHALDPTSPMSAKSLIKKISQNHRCLIFPEGRLTSTGALMKIYEGPGMIADKAKATLLPIRIDGAQYSPFTRLKGKVRTRWFPKITVTILPAHVFVVPDELKGRARRSIISAKLYDLMTELMFDSSDHQKSLFVSLIDAGHVVAKNHEAIEDVNRKAMTYSQFILKAFVLGRYIAENSKPQENIGILLPNIIPTAVAVFACLAQGRVPAMLNFSTGTKSVLQACHIAKITQIYTAHQFIEKARLQEMVLQLKNQNIHIIYLEDLLKNITFKHKIYGWLFSKTPTFCYKKLNPCMTPDDPAIILFTSGSEGTPKGVVLSHKNIQANRYQMSARVDCNHRDIVFNALPVFHAFGLTGGMMLPLLSGLKTFFYPSPLHYRVVPELVYDTNATLLFGTDTFLAGYARLAHPYDFYSIRYVFAGAEKLKQTTRECWSEKFGVRIFEGYGATETSPVLSINTAMQNKPGTVGRFLPRIIHKLEEVPDIVEGGRLIVAGPNIMLGYLKEDQPGEIQAPTEGWYDTGDIVKIDDQGFMTILGRAKRFAKIAGEMVSLTAIESHINQLWPNYLHAIIALEDSKKGEQLVLITDYLEAKREALRDYYKMIGVPELQLPKKILFLKPMLLLGTGKLDYLALKKHAETQISMTSQAL